jgi:hypothetical protein
VIREVGAAVNVLAPRDGPTVPQPADVGVRRVSTGGSLARATYGALADAAGEAVGSSHIESEVVEDASHLGVVRPWGVVSRRPTPRHVPAIDLNTFQSSVGCTYGIDRAYSLLGDHLKHRFLEYLEAVPLARGNTDHVAGSTFAMLLPDPDQQPTVEHV